MGTTFKSKNYSYSLVVCENQIGSDFIVNLETNSDNFTTNLFVNTLWFDLDLSYYRNISSSDLKIEIVTSAKCVFNDSQHSVNYGIFPCQILDSIDEMTTTTTTTVSPNGGGGEDLSWIAAIFVGLFFVSM